MADDDDEATKRLRVTNSGVVLLGGRAIGRIDNADAILPARAALAAAGVREAPATARPTAWLKDEWADWLAQTIDRRYGRERVERLRAAARLLDHLADDQLPPDDVAALERAVLRHLDVAGVR